MELRRFQKEFLAKAMAPGVNIGALSLPRGNGKSFLAAHLLTRSLTPDDELFVDGQTVVQCAGSLDQARICYNFARAALEPLGGYRFIDSSTRMGITHLPSNSKLRVISSNGKTAMGLVGVPLAVCDEPGSWQIGGGQLMWTALTGALGKPGSPLKIVVIGTLAPSATSTGHWWYDLIDDGTQGSTYVMAMQGDTETWDSWATIRRCNPLTAVSADFRKRLLEERDKARTDTRDKAAFLSYRLNQPSADESETLLTVDDWKIVEGRDVPPRTGKPIVGVDLSGGRAWSAAVAIWSNGRTESIALAPGIPSIEQQERRDRVPKATYQRLHDLGVLDVATGLRQQPPLQLWERIRDTWGRPRVLVCDRFRYDELVDAVKGGATIEPRVTRWSEAAYDIRALRKLARDGPLSVVKDSRLLLATSLSRARVINDDSGNTRLLKRGTNNISRDDVAAALLLAAGAVERMPPATGSFFRGMVSAA